MTSKDKEATRVVTPATARTAGEPDEKAPAQKDEIGGPKGPEPTRFGDWERNGRCSDF